MPDSKTIGERIKALREANKISQSELANIVGVGLSSISMYESGDRMPRDEIKIRIANALNRSVNFIFFKE